MTREEILKNAKSILFNTEMVQAIQNGTKTTIRRPVKFLGNRNPNWTGYIQDGLALYNENNEPCSKKPPYEVGDILYVREAWRKEQSSYDQCVDTSSFTSSPVCFMSMVKTEYFYRADCEDEEINTRWHPSNHMPKEAARIFLRVTDIRVERLQDINNAGALAEGCDGRGEAPQDGALSDCQMRYDFSVEKFQTVWDSTIKKSDREKYGWDANPWVWVIEFEKIEG